MKQKQDSNTEQGNRANTLLYAVAPTPKLSTDGTALDCVSDSRGSGIGATSKPSIQLFNVDNIEYMLNMPDKSVDLAIVDPPYGIGQNWSKDRKSQFYKHRNTFNNSIPGEQYFNEMFRVSRHQIVWGANYYWNFLPPSNNLIFWDKGKDAEKQFGSAGEIAWTSITKFPLIKVTLNWNGCVVCEDYQRIHPHQKPVKLYRWCLEKFAKPGWTILDTHLGSGSSAVAAKDLGFNFIGLEKDKTYFDAAATRIENHRTQLSAFSTNDAKV